MLIHDGVFIVLCIVQNLEYCSYYKTVYILFMFDWFINTIEAKKTKQVK